MGRHFPANDGQGADGVAQMPMPSNTNALRDGLASPRTPAAAHPVADIQNNFLRRKMDCKARELSMLYGSHMMMRQKMEEAILSRHQRLPGLKSEFVGLSSLLALDSDFGFEDCLNDPWQREEPSILPLHDAMEARLKL